MATNSKGRIPRNIAGFHAYLMQTTAYLSINTGGTANWQRLGWTQEEMRTWAGANNEWLNMYVKYADKKLTRTTAIKDKLHKIKNDLIAYEQEHKLLNRIESSPEAVLDDWEAFHIKTRELRDNEPSPVHGSHLGTGAPIAAMKNMGGAIIDLRFRRTADQTRPSLPNGFAAEISYQIGGAVPVSPDAAGMKNKISSKARFQFDAGMSNLGKTLYVFARFKHKTNEAAYPSPWTNLMQIIIA
jgi:hypothetical protein